MALACTSFLRVISLYISAMLASSTNTNLDKSVWGGQGRKGAPPVVGVVVLLFFVL